MVWLRDVKSVKREWGTEVSNTYHTYLSIFSLSQWIISFARGRQKRTTANCKHCKQFVYQFNNALLHNIVFVRCEMIDERNRD